MSKRVQPFAKGFALILLNLVILALLLAGLEIYLRLTDSFLRLPFDTSYYKNNKQYYPELIVPPGILEEYFTWGFKVDNNAFGFRERELDRPKPADLCRIVILGDSFTWGTGLALEERYGTVVEARLNEAFPDRKIEVISWARRGWTTVKQRDELRNFRDWLQPDYLVVGFVLNDPQVEYQGTTPEKVQFYEDYGDTIHAGLGWLIWAGLPRTAKTTQTALDNFLVKSGFLPPWESALQQNYEPEAATWQAFEQALADIKAMSDEMNLPPPLFIVLNQDNFWDRPTALSDQSASLPVYLRWYHQAEQAAAEKGFKTYNHEKELLEQLSRAEIPVNVLDFHPSAKVNQVYAAKLFDTLAAELKAGYLCQPELNQGAVAATAAPLAGQRRLSVMFGPQIRFLGYTADTQALAGTRSLALTFGWQALAETKTNYTLVLELLDAQGKVWLQQKALPCRGDCLMAFWPAGLIAPPGAEIVYWPKKSELLPMPVGKLPYKGKLRDNHTLSFGPEIPAGDYLLTLALYQGGSDEFLPVFDEISYTSPLQNRVILGTINLSKP